MAVSRAENGIFCDHQYGFWQRQKQYMHLYIFQGFDCWKKSLAVYLDPSEAFDTTNDRILLQSHGTWELLVCIKTHWQHWNSHAEGAQWPTSGYWKQWCDVSRMSPSAASHKTLQIWWYGFFISSSSWKSTCSQNIPVVQCQWMTLQTLAPFVHSFIHYHQKRVKLFE